MGIAGVVCPAKLKQKFTTALLLALLGIAARNTPAAAQGEYTPKSGQPGKDIVWVGNPPEMVRVMLDLAGVTPADYVFDLGSGDGRNVIAAAKRGARAHGIEYNADLVDFSRRLAAKEGVSDRATFERGDVFSADFSQATVVVLFLTPEMNIRLRPKLLRLKPGVRVVANTFAIGDWNPDRIEGPIANCNKFCTARLWIVPAMIAGRWQLSQGELTLSQVYQSFSGELKNARDTIPVTGRLRGEWAHFSTGITQFTARVDGKVMQGFARRAGVDRKFRATRVGR